MGGFEPVAVFWNEWGILVMVLFSFLMQITLLLLADFRRHKDSGVLNAFIWSAYTLGDTTAVFVLGHMSVMCKWSPEQQLMALWAPLLLVHLGGQDHITAYAIEDNRLWLRHLQIMGLQVIAVGFVMSGFSILGGRTLPWLRAATILVGVAGFLKYAEKVWMLWRASNSASSSLSATGYKDFRSAPQQPSDLLSSLWLHLPLSVLVSSERRLVMAYKLLDVPKQLFEGPTRYVKIDDVRPSTGFSMFLVARIQLSMMYDVLYTKAVVIHSWYGVCSRIISVSATLSAFLLFHGSDGKDGYGRGHVAATYALLGGAVAMEATSVLRSAGSRWTSAILLRGRCYRLARLFKRLRLLVTWPLQRIGISKKYWRQSMRQHSLFWLCACSRNKLSSKIARLVGWEDCWDSMFHSWSTPIDDHIIDRVVKLVELTANSRLDTTKSRELLRNKKKSKKNKSRELNENNGRTNPPDITNSRGRNALTRSRDDDLAAWTMDLALDESILVWHIATRIYTDGRTSTRSVNAAMDLSRYMFYLLAERPYMLPYPISRRKYVQLCYDVTTHLMYNSVEDLVSVMKDHGEALYNISQAGSSQTPVETTNPPAGFSDNDTLNKGCKLGAQLIHGGADPDMVLEVWVEMLCYAAYGCNENSHAKQLSSGGEIMTTVALLMLYMSSGLINKEQPVQDDGERTTTSASGMGQTSSGGASNEIVWGGC